MHGDSEGAREGRYGLDDACFRTCAMDYGIGTSLGRWRRVKVFRRNLWAVRSSAIDCCQLKINGQVGPAKTCGFPTAGARPVTLYINNIPRRHLRILIHGDIRSATRPNALFFHGTLCSTTPTLCIIVDTYLTPATP